MKEESSRECKGEPISQTLEGHCSQMFCCNQMSHCSIKFKDESQGERSGLLEKGCAQRGGLDLCCSQWGLSRGMVYLSALIGLPTFLTWDLTHVRCVISYTQSSAACSSKLRTFVTAMDGPYQRTAEGERRPLLLDNRGKDGQ